MQIVESSSVITLPVDEIKTAPKSWTSWFIGKPLANKEAPHQAIGKLIGLAVFSSDAMSSVAYAPQEMLLILGAAGVTAFGISIPMAIAIIVLLAILTTSYQQTIHAYPGGGGAYIVARDNLGELPAQTAGAALLTDYILTVSVSVSSGVAQLVSAYPALYDYRVWIAIGMVMLVMVINLRGVKESGTAFAIPTYYFLLMMALIIIIGFVRFFTGNLASVPNPPELQTITNTLQPITLFLILKAFASGTTALTGVEAISNGITAFKEPRSKNAAQTLIWMAAILGSTMFGITFLAHQIGALPSEQETVISQLARTALGDRGLLYLAVITSTTVILMMAANTAFADFPRLSALQANDGFLPRQLTARGSRLVFSRGIVALALVSSLLIFVFQASVNRLIPLYAIGVFLSFTLSQTGMARRWWKSGHLAPDEELKEQGSTVHYEKHWMLKMIINGFGAVCTFIVMLVFATTKFTDGAYVVVILLPILVSIFFFIHRHYKNLARQLSLEKGCPERRITRHRIIMPIGGVHKGTLTALRFARTLSTDITAVYVAVNPEEKEKIQSKWEQWGDGIRLVILESPYRVFMEPLVAYIENLEKICKKGEVIDIIVPHFVPRHWWVNFLHTRTADTLRQALLHRDNVIITEIPYQVD